ncbi:E3 ubiquitin ligase TRIM40 [Neovison vison]|uniref:E3 ubiquitin ligase TRIM40 n=1 Tax=Neovison vison TaxID=452646 RepID=UPI001CF01F32|nr:E3 ubiquitin ligase TRIM40 [Neogale vison]
MAPHAGQIKRGFQRLEGVRQGPAETSTSRAFLSRWSVHRPLQNHAGEGGPVDRKTAWAMVPLWKDLEGERGCPTCQQPLRGALSAEGAPLFCPDPLLLPTAEGSASGVLRRPLHPQPCSEGLLGTGQLRPGQREKVRGVREERRPLLRGATPRPPEHRGRWEPAADGAVGLCEVQAEAERESLQQEAPLGQRPEQPKNRPLLLDDMLILVALCLQDLKLREFMKVGDFLDRNAPQNREHLQRKRTPSPLLPSCLAATGCFLDRPGSPQPPPPPPNSPSFCWASPPGG